MVRQAIRRLVAAAGVTMVLAALAVGSSGPAGAAPKGPTPTAVQITGAGVAAPIVVQQAKQPRLFQNLVDEVSWLATAKATVTAPSAKNLGPKYTVTLVSKTLAYQTYDLYPMAAGGPRAHRPAKQPGGSDSMTDGWFYGRLTMPETLRNSGVPLNAKPDPISGGIGGGSGTDINASSDIDPVAGVNSFLNQMRRLFLLNGAVLVVILVGLAGIAFLIRRRV